MMLLVFTSLILGGCGGGSNPPPPTTTSSNPPPTTSTASLTFPSGAYQHTQILGTVYNLSWSNDGTYVYIGIKAKTPGWVALAFSGDPHGSCDVAIGYVQNGQVVLNEYGYIDYNGTHITDTALGGANDLILISGSVSNGITTIEFKRKLNTGDKLDTVLVQGANDVIWAYGPDTGLTSEHSAVGSATMVIQ